MYSGVGTPRSHLFNQRRKPSFAFEVNAFSFYWLQQPQAGDPCWGPTRKAQQRCLRSGALRTGRSSPLSSCLTKPPQRFGILEWVMVTSQLLAASQVCRCQRLCCTEIVPPSFPTWRETSVEMEQQKYPF